MCRLFSQSQHAIQRERAGGTVSEEAEMLRLVARCHALYYFVFSLHNVKTSVTCRTPSVTLSRCLHFFLFLLSVKFCIFNAKQPLLLGPNLGPHYSENKIKKHEKITAFQRCGKNQTTGERSTHGAHNSKCKNVNYKTHLSMHLHIYE